MPDALLPLLSEPRPISREGSDARVNLAAPTGGEGDGVDCGALIDWQKGDGGPTGGIAMVGLLCVVLGTILVHDRVMTEGEEINSRVGVEPTVVRREIEDDIQGQA